MSNQRKRFFEANQDFHYGIQEISGNRWLRQVIHDLRKVLKLTHMLSLSIDGRLDQSLQERRAILAAIKSGNELLAQTTMYDHILSLPQSLVRSHPHRELIL